MTKAHAIVARRAPAPVGAYSHAVVVGSTVYVSAQGPYDPRSGKTVGPGVAEQTNQAIDNVEAILAAAGSGLEYVVRVDANLASMELFDEYDAIYRRRFPDPWPARSTVGSELGGILVALSCIAVITR
jgi:2-iminobutanoate/2-iminopropanoate deaminase